MRKKPRKTQRTYRVVSKPVEKTVLHFVRKDKEESK
jgi:hypothetical protein